MWWKRSNPRAAEKAVLIEADMNDAYIVGGFVGALLFTFLFRKIFLWLTQKLEPPLVQIFLANALSLATYTVAIGYSRIADLTSDELPHFLEGFSMGVLPQLVWLAYDLWCYRKAAA